MVGNTSQQQRWPDLLTWLRSQGLTLHLQRMYQDWQAIDAHRAADLDAVGNTRARQLRGLRALDLGTVIRIQPTVVAAARSAALPSTWSGQTIAFLTRYEAFYQLPGLLVLAVVLSNAIPQRPIPVGSSAVVAMALLVAVGWLVTKLVGHAADMLGRWGTVLAKLALFVGLLVASLLQDDWFPAVTAWLHHPAVRNWGHGDHVVADLQLDIGIPWALGSVTAIAGVKLVYATVRVTLEHSAPREAADIVQCALVINEFVDIAVLLEKLDIPAPDMVPAPRPDFFTQVQFLNADANATATPPYVTTDQRRELLRRLETTAATVEGPWLRALRTGDAAADHEITRTAHGIAVAIRRWKRVAALGGRDLALMRGKFATAVVNAADGEWALLAADDVTVREQFGRRLRRWLRTAVGVAILCVGLVAVAVNPLGLPSSGTGQLIGVLVYGLVVWLGTITAPRATERFMATTRIVGFTPPSSTTESGNDKTPGS